MSLLNIKYLWRGFRSKKYDLDYLQVISDAYRDIRNDKYADCILWCYKDKRKPVYWSKSLVGTNQGYGWLVYSNADYKARFSYLPHILPESLFAEDPDKRNIEETIHTNKPTIILSYLHMCKYWIGPEQY